MPLSLLILLGALLVLLVVGINLTRAARGHKARRAVAKGALVIDVRSPDEFAAGHAVNARNIPLSVIGQGKDDLPRDRMLVLYCASGMRSAAALNLLRKRGYTQVLNGGTLRDLA